MKIDSADLTALQNNQLSSTKVEPPPTTDSTQTNRLSSLVAQTDRVTLSAATQETQQQQQQETKVFQGKERILLMPPSEKANRMETVLSRLNEDQQQMLIDSNMVSEDDFLALAEQLDDTELSQLTNALGGLQTPPKINQFTPLGLTSRTAANNLVESLSSMDTQTRSRVLEQVDQHANKISGGDADTYQADGTLPIRQPSESANDLHNFVNTIRNTDDVNQTLDRLAGFSDSQQSDLLQILGSNIELGDRLIDSLSEREPKTQSSMLSFLSDLSKTVDPIYMGLDRRDDELRHGVPLNYDNQAGQVVWDMIDDSISLMEDYQFSDEQLQQMSDQLSHLGANDQRAYLSITTTGLEHLLGSEEGQPIDMEENEQVLSTIDALRNNDTVRDAVFESRVGESFMVDDQQVFELKKDGVGNRDQQQMIELLATDAFLNPQANPEAQSNRAAQLASTLADLGADQRDQQVDDLNALNTSSQPLAERDTEELGTSLQPLQDRTESLLNTANTEALLAAAEETPEEQQPQYWQTTNLAGESVDQLVNILNSNSPEIRAQVIDSLASVADQLNSGEQDEAQASQTVEELISYFSKDRSEDDKARFLEKI